MAINKIINNSSFINNLQKDNNVHIVISNNKLFIYTFIINEENLRLPTSMYIMEIKSKGNYIYDNFHNLITIENEKVKTKRK